MADFVIYSDSGCDLSEYTLRSWGVAYSELTFIFDGDNTSYKNYELSAEEFYSRLRTANAKTSAVNSETFKEGFEKYLSQGIDVLYLGFDSGISTTYNSGHLAAEELREKYPERKIIDIDTLCASVGQGLLLYMTVQKKNSGATIEETAEYVRNTMMSIGTWFTVDDLDYLKRGGRVSATTAFVGGLLDIKPILHIDNEGKLISVAKQRGRRKALAEIVKKYGELALDPANGPLAVANGDCREDTDLFISMMKEKYGVEPVIDENVRAVIGSHTGPSVIVVCFPAKER